MNIYVLTTNYISNLPVFKEWHEAKPLLKHAASQEPRDWRLPVAACEAVGGEAESGIPASASIACALIGILLIDDMLDDDPRGEFKRTGPAQAANFASAFLAASSEAILHAEMEPSAKLRAMESINQMILSVALGQSLDARNPNDENAYWRVVQLKSAPFFESAFELGALFGGAPIEMARRIGKIGSLYGEMIQIHDDMNDCMAVPANSDWIQNRSPLPILFARSVDHADRARFIELRRRTSESDALREAQEILVRCGAISYCIDQLLNRYREAHTVLTALHIVYPDPLESVLESVIAPVSKLFEAIGSPPPDLSTAAMREE